ncbi:MAG: LysM peptidoglycan-binding domain-containing protein [Solirubrobacteraceae bacterium]|nr:LysM peptidoglycan-binding domain-containing protein [Solirubrobacteraceae bacterium]
MAGRRSPARYLAPLSLVAVVIAVVVIVQSSRSASSDAGTPATTTTQSERAGRDRASTSEASGGGRKRRPRRTYVVKSGDILSTVAEKTGVSVAELQRLNPDIDPQALQVGQRLKLRPDADAGEGKADGATTATSEGESETP